MLKISEHKRSILKQFRPSNTSEEDALIEKNRILHNRHMGERCFILANGPSIKKQDLKLLQGETCIAVSDFDLHPDYSLIKPHYHCIAPYHPDIYEENWYERMARIDKNSGNAVMFFGLSDRERNSVNGLFAGRQVHYLKFTGEWNEVLAHGIDITCPVPKVQSVPVMALFVCLYLGFKQIYLLGCDHDWILHLNNYSYFYKEDQDTQDEMGYNPLFGTDFEAEARWNIILWQQYKIIRRIANERSIKIYNATAKGFLDVFPRVKYESLFDKKMSISVDSEDDLGGEQRLQQYLLEINQLRLDRRYGEALFSALRLVGEYPDSPDVINLCAELKFQVGDWLNAILILEDLVKQYPTYHTAFNNLGVIYWKIGDDKNSLQYFLKAFKVNPYDRDIILNLTESLKTIKKNEVAKKVYSTYLQKYPDDVEIVQALAGMKTDT